MLWTLSPNRKTMELRYNTSRYGWDVRAAPTHSGPAVEGPHDELMYRRPTAGSVPGWSFVLSQTAAHEVRDCHKMESFAFALMNVGRSFAGHDGVGASLFLVPLGPCWGHGLSQDKEKFAAILHQQRTRVCRVETPSTASQQSLLAQTRFHAQYVWTEVAIPVHDSTSVLHYFCQNLWRGSNKRLF